MSKPEPTTEKSEIELEEVVKRDDGPEHKAPSNQEYSSDFDEATGRDDLGR